MVPSVARPRRTVGGPAPALREPGRRRAESKIRTPGHHFAFYPSPRAPYAGGRGWASPYSPRPGGERGRGEGQVFVFRAHTTPSPPTPLPNGNRGEETAPGRFNNPRRCRIRAARPAHE